MSEPQRPLKWNPLLCAKNRREKRAAPQKLPVHLRGQSVLIAWSQSKAPEL